jgi:hypothetical protein
MSDPVPAIAEASATGAVAEIFADIRRVLGVEVVNLIWHHLATIPDALPWTWGMLRPLYADGAIAAEAQALHGQLALPHLPPSPRDLLAAIGLADDDLASIGHILAAYDRTNAMALVALSAVLNRLRGPPADSGQAAIGTPEPSAALPSTIPLPPLPGLDALSDPVVSLVLTLNRLGARRDSIPFWPACIVSWPIGPAIWR